MKKWISLMVALFLAGLFSMNVRAKEGQTVVALGADLTAAQRETVLGLLGMTEEQLAGCQVVYITNGQERQYLGAYLDASLIGSKSLSSVMLRKGTAGSGVNVTTRNINYCTTGMYRNALLTAGVQDTEVVVAAPSQMSGTAALIGAVKAYEKLEEQEISDESLSNALDELITTGELTEAMKNVRNEEIESLIAYIKEKVAAGELETEADIRAAIAEGEQRFGVTLDQEAVNQLVGLMNKLEKMGLDSSYLISQAEKLYNKYGSEIVNYADEAISEAVSEAAARAKEGLWESMKSAFRGFLNKLFG